MTTLADSRALLAILLAVPATFGCRSEPIELGLRLGEGDSLKTALVMEQSVVQDFGGGEYETNQEVAYRWREDVGEVADDGATWLDLTWESVYVRWEGPEFGVMEYDSDAPSGDVPPIAAGLDAAVGESIRLEIATDGAIRSAPGLDRLVDRVTAKIGTSAGAPAETIRSAVEQHFGEEAVRQRMATLLDVYPDGPVAEGDSWTRSRAISGTFPHVQTTEYELDDVDEHTVRLRVRSSLSAGQGSQGPVRSGTVDVRLTASGKQRGWLLLDRATGVVIAGEIEQDLEGTIVQSTPGGGDLSSDFTLEGRLELARELQ